ncbi:terminase, partial [Escherichia coli]|nr:terminase [Escherichia coli]
RLKQDLATPTYSYDKAGKIQLEAKDDIKARGLPSPDIADALALTFTFPVQKSQHTHELGTALLSDYDPFER